MILTIILRIALLVVVTISAAAITETITFHNQSLTFPDVDFCGSGDVMVTITYNGVMHITEFTADDPNAGSFHGRLKMNGTVFVVDGGGNVVNTDRFVKTIFHTNVNHQNLIDRFNFIVNGVRADGGRHRYHLNGHVNLSASGNQMTFTKLSISCP